MARRVGEPVEVRVVGDLVGEPASFLWRGRLYVVRDVLGHWRDRREWWATSAVRALPGDENGPARGEALDQEREVWRVEASAGRSYGSGVYDLSHESLIAVPSVGEAWRLLQIAD